MLGLRQGHEDGPDEAAELPGHGRDGDVAVLSLVEPEELPHQTALGLGGNGHDIGWLPLTAALQDESSTGIMTVVPGGLDQEAPDVTVASLGNRAAVFFVAGGVFRGDQPK